MVERALGPKTDLRDIVIDISVYFRGICLLQIFEVRLQLIEISAHRLGGVAEIARKKVVANFGIIHVYPTSPWN